MPLLITWILLVNYKPISPLWGTYISGKYLMQQIYHSILYELTHKVVLPVQTPWRRWVTFRASAAARELKISHVHIYHSILHVRQSSIYDLSGTVDFLASYWRSASVAGL